MDSGDGSSVRYFYLNSHGFERKLDLNIPVCGLAAAFVIAFLKLRTPSRTFREQIGRMDWMYVQNLLNVVWYMFAEISCSGNLIIVAATTSCVIALTWSRIQFPWRSAHVLVPLLVGLAGLAASLLHETYFPKNPVVRINLLTQRTSLIANPGAFRGHVNINGPQRFRPNLYHANRLAGPHLYV